MSDALSPDTLDLISLLLETDTLDGFLQALADSALREAPTAHGCGITLERRNRPLTVASSGVGAPPLDEAQYGQDDGPCLQALRTGQEVSVIDMRDELRWEGYPAFAARAGTLSSFSLPIAAHSHTAGALNLYSPAAHSHTAGALNLYSPEKDGFREAALEGLRSLTSQATGAIALAERLSDAQVFTADLQTALQSRAVIDQAVGIVMSQRHCTPDQALRTLRTASQHRNVKLRELCAQLVGSIAGSPPPAGPGLRPRP
ncbi:GAF and ANTAR domain-containing protein [Streptomyces pratensis]|uniref:GAF and ANTAR domain-containing protein n=1 Tax=Streptomyces pratensis TaxID=1169025 RepID=UPI00378FCCA4